MSTDILQAATQAGAQIIRPQAGPQDKASRHPADILIFGGSAGGGKTWLLQTDPLRHVGNPGFRGVIIRKTITEITDEGGLWDESFSLYPHAGGIAKRQKHRWLFPSGASIRFRHLENIDVQVEWKGTQACYLGFDQLEDMPESAFFYILSRNRSTCGVRPYVRATCNPQPGWLADFLAWWIDQETGYPLPERDGVIRWMARDANELRWYDTQAEALEDNPQLIEASNGEWSPKSVTFIRSRLEDNQILMERDPGYLSTLLSLPKIERMRLYDGNWRISADAIIDAGWLRTFSVNGDQVEYRCKDKTIKTSHLERFAVIDTAGTGKQKAAERGGRKPASYTAAGVFDYDRGNNMLLWRDVWRTRVGWNELKAQFPEWLAQWNVNTVLIENAHFGPALADEMRAGYRCIMVGPVVQGMATGSRGAKLERAVASGFLSRIEFGTLLLAPDWPRECWNQLTAWTGLDDEAADLIDVGSYAADYKRRPSKVMVA